MGLNRLSDTGAPHSADDLATLRRRFIEGVLIHFQSWAISGRIHVEI